jgi:hypothetical protein
MHQRAIERSARRRRLPRIQRRDAIDHRAGDGDAWHTLRSRRADGDGADQIDHVGELRAHRRAGGGLAVGGVVGIEGHGGWRGRLGRGGEKGTGTALRMAEEGAHFDYNQDFPDKHACHGSAASLETRHVCGANCPCVWIRDRRSGSGRGRTPPARRQPPRPASPPRTDFGLLGTDFSLPQTGFSPRRRQVTSRRTKPCPSRTRVCLPRRNPAPAHPQAHLSQREASPIWRKAQPARTKVHPAHRDFSPGQTKVRPRLASARAAPVSPSPSLPLAPSSRPHAFRRRLLEWPELPRPAAHVGRPGICLGRESPEPPTHTT